MLIQKLIYPVSITVLFLPLCVQSAKILGVFPMAWSSHYFLGNKLLTGLANAGHDVTMVSPFKFKGRVENGTWTDVLLEGFIERFQGSITSANLLEDSKKNLLERMTSYVTLLKDMSNQTFYHPNVQRLLKSNAHFDAVVVDVAMNDCHHFFAYHFGAPLVLLSTIGPNVFVNLKVGNPTEFTSILDAPVEDLSLVARSINLLKYAAMHMFYQLYFVPMHEEILHQAFPQAPPIQHLLYNASLVLLNSHPSLTGAVATVPNMVEMGGFHVDPPQKLPQDLQQFLDGATEGAIFFSMGSTLKSKDMSDDQKTAFIKVFGKLKQRVLWKFEEELQGKPDNVLIRSWLPQQDILAHPNVKLFITHGGLLSTIETIYHGIPVLAIPIFGDQFMNAAQAVKDGFGLKLGFADPNFNEATLSTLIGQLLNNETYRLTAQRKSKVFHDRPVAPLRSAVYWVEYVIRNKGAPHLRVAAAGMPWYQYFMVDVIACLVGCLVLACLVVKKLVTLLLRPLRGKEVKKLKKN